MTLMMNFELKCISNIGRGRTVWMASAHAGPAAVTGGQTRGVRIKNTKNKKYKNNTKNTKYTKKQRTQKYKEHKKYVQRTQKIQRTQK